MAGDTKVRMIKTTGRLMREQGFHATGLNQIVAEADAPKGSMYFHFPGGKVDLAVAAVDNFVEAISDFMRDEVAGAGSVADAVETFLEASARRLERSDFRSGCVVATLALEAGAQQPEIGDACDRGLRAWTGLVADGLRHEGFDDDEAERRAELVIMALEGGIAMAKARRDATPLRSLARTLRDLVLVPPS